MTAASLALRLFGTRVRRDTLATVLDVDTAAPHADDPLYPEPWPEEQAARALLESATAAVQQASGRRPGSVILAGEPADALEQYAIAEDYEVIVIGCRGKGLTKLVLGSCASSLASRTKVPALLIPTAPGGAQPTPDP
jgi:nucleotide-binding universal stress UspA family protein